MATIRCSKCGAYYDSTRIHVCHVGGEEDIHKGKFSETEGGTGGGRP